VFDGIQTVDVDDSERSESDASSTRQLAANQFHNLVDLFVALMQVRLHAHTHSARIDAVG